MGYFFIPTRAGAPASFLYPVLTYLSLSVSFLALAKVTEYFSYEHFYVVFCRFYELDADRDGRLSGEDLIKYGEHGLSRLIVDR